MKVKLVAFTKAGTEISKRLIPALKEKGYIVEAFSKYPEGIVEKLEGTIYEFTRKCFEEEVQGIIFIGALGIAVRAIAPNIVSKGKDPAVIVMDDIGRFVIPVLSGHIGGANELASYISKKLQVTPVITTATDGHGAFAIDTWAVKNQCTILDISKIKYVSAALLRGEKVGLICDYPVEGKLPE
ncbi:MAG: cobalamin biosynthesis central domain-containing protein, partial [Clostridium sp.]